jgi:hypothetical protein
MVTKKLAHDKTFGFASRTHASHAKNGRVFGTGFGE